MRGRRTWRPSLEDYDLSDIDSYHMGSGGRVFAPTHGVGTGERFNSSTTLGSGSCWCGEKGYHDWPGRAEGRPHPR